MSGLMVAVRRQVLAAIYAAALAAVYTSSCMAADDDFYKGKTLTMAVASKPGGGTDTSARRNRVRPGPASGPSPRPPDSLQAGLTTSSWTSSGRPCAAAT